MPETDLCCRQVLFGGASIPVGRLGRIANNTGTLKMKRGYIDLSGSDALLRGPLEPFRRLSELLRHAFTACIEASETKLCLGISNFCRPAVPLRSFDQAWDRGLATLV